MNQAIASSIRTIPGHPKPGINFRDITTLLENPKAFRMAIDQIVHRYMDKNITAVAGIESRGFVFGSVVAYELGVGFLSIRKAGKLPAETISQSYQLEYGEDTMEIHKDCIKAGDRILLIDDLIATGGTVSAAIKLIRQLEGVVVESCFIIDLPDLGGSKKVQEEMDCPCFSLCEFEGD
ncbi:adenine phosphoribosyltransferase [Leucothrix sargassi]|nr:adenine phosphoribosyltransferase [Leucothrix sargassi]